MPLYCAFIPGNMRAFFTKLFVLFSQSKLFKFALLSHDGMILNAEYW